MTALIIFDFDGVVADSELLANVLLADAVTALGVPTSLHDSYERYMGKRLSEILPTIEAAAGRPLPANFADDLFHLTRARFRAELQPVAGVREFIAAFEHVPRCIASSSTPERIGFCLEVMGLGAAFEPNVFSATMVARGKPHPDVFVHAAAQMGTDPARCLVIEDSATGVAAGVAAGMRVIGLTAASHVEPGHGDRLVAAGAHHVAASYGAAGAIVRDWLCEIGESA